MKLLPLLVAAAAVLPLALLPKAGGSASAALAAQAAAYEVDPGHSSVVFRIQHFVAPFYGRFNKVSGAVSYDAKKPEASSVEITIDAASVDTNSSGRDDHLRGPDFFSAKEFPQITFVSKSVAKKGDKLAINGDLTMRGTTKSVTVEAAIIGEADTGKMGYRCGFETVFEIKRSDFGVKGYLPAIGDDVRIMVGLECMKK